MKNIIIIWGMLLFYMAGFSQGKYWVFFKDKGTATKVTFDQKALEKKQRLQIPEDEKDRLVDKEYINQVALYADSLGYESRWLNGIAIYASEENIDRINRLGMVKEIVPVYMPALTLAVADLKKEDPEDDLEALAKFQLERMDPGAVLRQQFTGQGVRIAILDAGFKGARENKALQHLFEKDKIKAMRDFIRKDSMVFRGDYHGSFVWCNIAGKFDSTLLGFAQDAEFILARTENTLTESPAEEDRWIAALEWAEQMGADIVNSSLGYTVNNHFKEEMDGNSRMSKAVDIAAEKGMLVVNSAGNDFRSSWKIIGVPADARGALTVGGTDPSTDYQAWFSSVGPTADKRLKPEVSAPGIVANCQGNKWVQVSGTSFSAPLVTGFLACILEKETAWNALQLKENAVAAGHLFPYYDYAHGYGIPQSSVFFLSGEKDTINKTFSFVDSAGVILFYPEVFTLKKERKSLLYYHLADVTGYIHKYGLLEISSTKPVGFCTGLAACIQMDSFYEIPESYILLSDIRKKSEVCKANGWVLRVHYEGFTETFLFH